VAQLRSKSLAEVALVEGRLEMLEMLQKSVGVVEVVGVWQ